MQKFTFTGIATFVVLLVAFASNATAGTDSPGPAFLGPPVTAPKSPGPVFLGPPVPAPKPVTSAPLALTAH
jgi:hypothetical protein